MLRGGHVDRALLPGLVGGAGVSGDGRALGGVKRVRLTQKNSSTHLAGYGRDGGFSVPAKGLEEIESC